MSFARRALPTLRQAAGRRSYATAAPFENSFVTEREALKAHAGKSGELWRKVTYYFAFPAIIVGYLNAEAMMAEHETHAEHLKAENGGESPERTVYSYMNKRAVEFPWGNHTIFFNPHVNIEPEA